MKNEIIESYLQDVCSYIKNKDMHKEIEDEIRDHIYEIVDEYISDGLSEEQSINEAIKRLGSASECGIKLNKIHKAKPDIISIVLALVLAVTGVITMYSIEKNNVAENTSFINNVEGLVIGGVIASGIYFFDYRKFKRYSYHIYCTSIVILIITFIKTNHFFVVELGKLYISSISIHLAVTALILISLSGVINLRCINNKFDLIFVGVMGAIPLILFLIVRDVTVGLIYLCGINMIFLTSKVNKSLKISLVCIELLLSLLGLLAIISEPYRLARIVAIINPVADPYGSGYAIIRIRELLFQSNLLGNDMHGIKLRIPDLENNFALVYIIYKFGIVFGAICVSIIIAFLVRMFNIISKVKDTYGRTLVLSIGYIFFMQILINLLSNLGIIPVYIELPFICFGSISTIISISMVGLICSIYRRREISDRTAY